jgi:hypothetical protein
VSIEEMFITKTLLRNKPEMATAIIDSTKVKPEKMEVRRRIASV